MKRIYKYLSVTLLAVSCCTFIFSCSKFTELAPPASLVVGAEAFSTDANAASTIAGLYNKLVATGFAQSATTVMGGLSSDELSRFNAADEYQQVANNTIQPNNNQVTSIWTGAYGVIAQANACIDGLDVTTKVTDTLRTQFLGEALFIRAFCYFYLTGFYGDVPLMIYSDWTPYLTMGRSPRAQVYRQIVADLTRSRALFTDSKKVHANKLAATALLARTYLYMKNYDSAALHATTVIDDVSMPKVLPATTDAFLIASKEAILQFLPAQQGKAVTEASQFITLSTPVNYLTTQQYASFETGDKRKTDWVTSKVFQSNTYYIPYKYKSTSATVATEYYMVLRLAEQYLIRAEARANKSEFDGVVADLNIIRTRAGLGTLSAINMDKDKALDAVMKERRTELFAEWGHRWFDLVRTGAATTVLKLLKPATWKDYAVFYPVPFTERQKSTFLSQNDGYPQ